MRRLRILFLVLLLPAAARAIDVNDPPKGVFADEWYAVMMAGAKSGHMHNTFERTERDGKEIIRTKTDMTMIAGRGEVQIQVNMLQTTEETLDGEPLRFTSKQTMAKVATVTQGTFSNGKVRIVEKQFGFFPTDAKTYDLPKGAKMSWGAYREQIAHGLDPGSKFEISIYEPTLAPDKLITTQVEVHEKESLDLFGRKVDGIRTTQKMQLPGTALGEMNLSTTTWLTEEGEVLKMRMSIMNIDVDLVACSKAVALSKNDPADLMTDTLIRATGDADSDAATMRFRLEWDQDMPAMPETDMQKVVKREDKSAVLVNTRYSARPKTPGKPLTDEEKERYLAATSTLNHKDPQVARLAKKAAAGETDPEKLADQLRRFVSDYVKSKNLSVGFATASEVARSKEGDCSEHGVLLAALGRAVGIPSRVATGYVHAEEFLGQENIFVGHLWTQFHINGQWVDVDAALHQTDVDPTHIVFAVSEESTGLADLVGAVWMSSRPKITILEEKSPGKE